jgi:hypothetical protein
LVSIIVTVCPKGGSFQSHNFFSQRIVPGYGILGLFADALFLSIPDMHLIEGEAKAFSYGD